MAAGFTEIDGIRCYAPEVAVDHADYPSEGFDVTASIEERSFWCRTRNRILRIVLDRFFPPGPPLALLELGCGTGAVLKSLRSRTDLTLTGSEIYLSGLRHARRRLPDINFIQLDATNIPFREEFDIIGAFDVLEHIEADQTVMQQAYRALRPGGRFIVTVPQYQWMWAPLDEIVRHKRRYQRADLSSRLRAAGFEVEYLSSFVTTLFPLMATARLFGRLRNRSSDARADFETQVVFPGVVNDLFDVIMRIDEAALRAGWSLPFGGSLLAVARRPF